MRHERTRLTVALLTAALLHVALLLYLSRPGEAPPARHAPMTLVEVPALPLPTVQPTPPPPAPVVKRRAPRALAAAATAGPTSAANPPATTSTGDAPSMPAADAPRSVSLLPSLSGLGGRLPSPESSAPGGVTIRNGPGEAPDPQALAEYRAEISQRRASDLLGKGVGEAARNAGGVDPYFLTALSRMRSVAKQSPLSKSITKGIPPVLDAYMAAAELYGSGRMAPTTSPNAPPPSVANPSFGADLQALNLGTQLQNQAAVSNSAAPPAARLEAIVELEQVPGGGVALANVVRSSGTRDFDELALHAARRGFIGPGDGPDAGVGAEGRPWRSFWRFTYEPPTVRVELLRLERGGRANPFVGSPD